MRGLGRAACALVLFLLIAPDVMAQDGAAPSLSLADLDALMVEDEQSVPALESKKVIDLVALIGFLSLATISFLQKSTILKYVTMVVAIAYMGFAKANLVSMVHLFGVLEWSFPIFKYNVTWYMLMGFTLLSTILFGRVYCGRICPFGAFTQLMDVIIPSRFRYELPKHLDKKAIYLKYLILFAVIVYFLITRDNFVYKYVEPFWMFTLNGTTVMWVLLSVLILITIFVRNFYCRYLCSVGAGLGLISNLSVFRIKRWKQCNSCKVCEKVCKWGAIEGPKILVTECVRCDDCEIIYNDKDRCVHWLMIKKKSLREKRLQRA
jgi:NosR/NirI family nitrous oxide reductase transcriptional regulator